MRGKTIGTVIELIGFGELVVKSKSWAGEFFLILIALALQGCCKEEQKRWVSKKDNNSNKNYQLGTLF